MVPKQKKKKAFSSRARVEIRDFISKELVDDGMTVKKFKKLMGVKK